jgi:DNA-binding transcriptional LysR family regulator
MPTIRLHQLEGFFYVARLGGYTKAAQAFSYPIGQPAVYQQVRGLQEDLGVTLVVQAGPRRTELTPEGRALYEFLAPFFDGLPKLVERISGAAAAPLILAADQFLATEALPQALSKTLESFPGFRLRLEESPTEEIVQFVTNGQADAGLVHLAEPPPNMVWEPLGRIGVAMIIPLNHPLAKLKRAPTPAEIGKHPLIVYGPSSPRRVLTERLFKYHGENLKVAVEVSFSHTMRAFVREGFAPAFVPYLLGGQKGIPSAKDSLPREPGTISFDVSAHLKGGALPFGLLYRQGTEESVAFRALAGVMRKLWK